MKWLAATTTKMKNRRRMSVILKRDGSTMELMEVARGTLSRACWTTMRMKRKKRMAVKKAKKRKRSFRRFAESMSSLRLTSQSASPRSYAHSGKLIQKCMTKVRPSTNETEDIIKLFDAGMACARINLSHGTKKVRERVRC